MDESLFLQSEGGWEALQAPHARTPLSTWAARPAAARAAAHPAEPLPLSPGLSG